MRRNSRSTVVDRTENFWPRPDFDVVRAHLRTVSAISAIGDGLLSSTKQLCLSQPMFSVPVTRPSLTTAATRYQTMAPTARVALRPPSALRRGAVRWLAHSAITRNASQPAPASSSAQNPHGARVAATASSPSSSNSGGDARSRLARLQAQRLEELNRGRTGGGGAAARPNKPEQKWSNRTLIALATCVGACTYLMGTYHGYNAGKAHAQEQVELQASVPLASPGVTSPPLLKPGTATALPAAPVQTSTLSAALMQLLPSGLSNSAIQCEPEAKAKCRLAELTPSIPH